MNSSLDSDTPALENNIPCAKKKKANLTVLFDLFCGLTDHY